MWSQSTADRTVFFRKEFTLPSTNYNGLSRTNIDDDGDIYINGNHVFSNYDGIRDGIYSGDVSQYLIAGTNVIAIKAVDYGGCQYVQFELQINHPPILTITPTPTPTNTPTPTITITPTPILFSDDFNDGNYDGWEVIGSHKAHSDYGNWRVENGALVQDAGGDGYMAFVDNLNLSNQTIEARIKFIGVAGYGGFVFWFQDYNNLARISVYPATGKIWIAEWINGISVDTPYSYSTNYNLWYDLKADVDSISGDISVYVNGVNVFTHHLVTTNRSGRTGLWNGNSGSYFDDFKLTVLQL